MSFPPDLPLSPSVPYKDRKTGLTIFGILTILIGLVFALFVPFILVSQRMAQQAGGPTQDLRMLLPGMVMYGGLAVAYLCLGIGSVKARRWARALLLILSWGWLLFGVVMTAVMAFVLPQILKTVQTAAPSGQPAPPPEIMSVVNVAVVGIMGLVLVALPALWVFFYGSRHVKATCEAEDPVERWTDRCPLPVLAVSLWLLSTLPILVVTIVIGKAVLPCFGRFVVGPAASVSYLLLVALWGYAAWAIYKLRLSGWWIVTVSLLLFTVSAFLTYSQHDLSEVYRLLQYPAEQIALMEKFNFMSGPRLAWLTVASMVPLLGYLLFVRRYFRRPVPVV